MSKKKTVDIAELFFTSKDVPKDVPKNVPKDVPKDVPYAIKPKDEPHKPYKGWWDNQMEAIKELKPDVNQNELNRIVLEVWNEKSIKTKIGLWALHSRRIKEIKRSVV